MPIECRNSRYIIHTAHQVYRSTKLQQSAKHLNYSTGGLYASPYGSLGELSAYKQVMCLNPRLAFTSEKSM